MNTSMGRTLLAEWLAPHEEAQFLEHELGREVLHISGDEGRFEQVLTPGEFLESVHKLAAEASSDVRFSERKQPGDFKRVTLGFYGASRDSPCWGNLEELSADCIDGRTLICNSLHIHNSKVAKACRRNLREFGEFTGANAYFSPPNSPVALGWHYDCWDVFVLQLAGCKDWRVYRGENELPVTRVDFSQPEREIPEDETSFYSMKAGDLLYLPRGTWHRPTARDELSLHLTVGVHRRTRLHLGDWISHELSSKRHLRAFLPLDPFDMPHGDDVTGEIQREIDAYCEEIRKLMRSPDAVSRYRIFCLQSSNRRMNPSTPRAPAEE